VASWFDRSKPLQGRTWLDLTTGAAMLLLVSGPQAPAEDEPAAKAPLPPLLRGTPAEAGERQMPAPAPSRNQSDPRAPAIRFDRPKSQLSQKKLASTPRRISVPRSPRSEKRLRDLGSIRRTPPLVGKATALSPPKRGKGGTGRRPSPRSASFPPRGDYPDPPIGSTTEPLAHPRRAPPFYYPNYFAGPPAYGYAPSYPYAWGPPGPGAFPRRRDANSA
jgi:hypothetical protein